MVAGGLACLLAIAGCAGKKDLKLEMTRETVIHPPVISAIALDPSGVFDTRGRGSTVNVTMTGDPGLDATFDVEGRFEGQTMEETEAGVYRGSFEVVPGEEGDLWVVGHLVHAESGANQDYRSDRALTLRPSPPPPPEPKVCTREMAAAFDQKIRGLTTYFAFDEHDLVEESKATLTANREVLSSEPLCTIFVLGHTDDVGEEQYNDALSAKRAATVVGFLETLGISNTRIVERHFGEHHPANGANRSRNRRVELRAVNPYGE
jgi:outer membrane protein OmpA-like peptidoglycan-associated protein